MDALSILRAARAHLAADPSRLARNAIALDANGLCVSAIDERACAWCVIGLVLRAREVEGLPDDFDDPGNAAMRAFREANGINFRTVATWSDAHDAAEIIAAFDKAIAYAERSAAA